jgi:hypothetical protein
MEIRVGTKQLLVIYVPILLSKSTKEVFSVQGAWHYPKTLPSMVRGQDFSIII